MNPSTALARVLVDALVRGGVREAVLSPGSRSAPLAFALHAADADGRLRLHVRIDERTAGFLALGLAKASGRPVPVVTTSGTAAVNLHPAVVEAFHARVPLIALTADRPPELRGIGANQTIDQVGLFGSAVSWQVDVPPATGRLGQVAGWRALVAEALAATRSGPVHVNLGLREPLTPSGDEHWVEPLDLVGDAGADLDQGSGQDGPGERTVVEDLPARGVVVLADGAAALAGQAHALAADLGWPVLAEPSSGGRCGHALGGYGWLLSEAGFAAAHVPDLALVVGRPTLSRAVASLLRHARDHWVVDTVGTRPDPTSTASRFLAALPLPAGQPLRDPGWLGSWADADRRARAAVTAVLDGTGLSGATVARDVVATVPADALLVLGSSQAIRDVDLFAAPRDGVRVLANRGAAGIDGTVSTAVGAALAHGGAGYALVGDLTFLHDGNGLVIGPGEPRPDLTVVVNNDDGGAIFGLLEQGAPEHAAVFERVFGTPHGVDLAALCAATGTAYARAGSRGELVSALAPGRGLRVVEVRTDRSRARELHDRVRRAVGAALAG